MNMKRKGLMRICQKVERYGANQSMMVEASKFNVVTVHWHVHPAGAKRAAGPLPRLLPRVEARRRTLLEEESAGTRLPHRRCQRPRHSRPYFATTQLPAQDNTVQSSSRECAVVRQAQVGLQECHSCYCRSGSDELLARCRHCLRQGENLRARGQRSWSQAGRQRWYFFCYILQNVNSFLSMIS